MPARDQTGALGVGVALGELAMGSLGVGIDLEAGQSSLALNLALTVLKMLQDCRIAKTREYLRLSTMSLRAQRVKTRSLESQAVATTTMVTLSVLRRSEVRGFAFKGRWGSFGAEIVDFTSYVVGQSIEEYTKR